ncbi:MAG TPA: SseB family protein [Geopsychrobacteraceae bacterium]|nr:SseB family protein [Geopsychrobacteraceae bacterium]
MSELDQALEVLRAKPDDAKAQSGFYDLFLNSSFFVPTAKEMVRPDAESPEEEIEVPLVIESEGRDYLVFFDQQQRLNAWAETDAPCLQLPGHVLAEMTTEGLFWVMNIGTEHLKQFAPDEIAWLKEVVERCKAEAEKLGE